MGRTLTEKVWDEHVVRAAPGEPDLLYIDLHLIHEVTSPHRQLRPHGDRVAQPRRTLGRRDADPVLTLAPPQLGGLAGDVPQPCQDGPGRGEQAVLAGSGAELGEPGTEDEAALHVAGDEPVVLEGDREPVGGRPG